MFVQLLEYDHYNRMSAAQALKHPWLGKPNPLTQPFTSAGSAVMSSLDNTVGQLIDTKSFTNMRESLSEAELYSALADSDEEKAQWEKESRQTVAWWQAKAVRLPLYRPASSGVSHKMH